jgi:hypothetical protein
MEKLAWYSSSPIFAAIIPWEASKKSSTKEKNLKNVICKEVCNQKK